jgi:hypothetical protein
MLPQFFFAIWLHTCASQVVEELSEVSVLLNFEFHLKRFFGIIDMAELLKYVFKIVILYKFYRNFSLLYGWTIVHRGL